MAEDPWSHSFHNAMLHRDPHRVLTSVLIGSTWRRQALPILHASLTFQNHQAVGSQGTQFGNRWRNVGAREELPLYFPTYLPGMVRRQRRCRSSLHCHTLHNKWLVLLWVQWRCSGGESHPNPPQPFPCQSELTEQFHPTRHSTGGPSECLRPCTTHLMRPPLLCKLMPISYATLIFQSYHDCSVGRGLVPSCAKRASRPTNGSQGLELLSFSK